MTDAQLVRIAISWFLVTFLTAGAYGLWERSVLCVGADGHVEVESALSRCCRAAAAPGAPTALADVPPGADGCGGCTDMVMSLSTTLRESGAAIAEVPSTRSSNTHMAPHCASAPDADRAGSRPLGRDPGHARRGVVLLI